MMWIGKRRRPARAGGPPSRSESGDIADQFQNAWLAADGRDAAPELMPVRLARACVAVLPVAGAGISLLHDDFRVPLGASDPDASCAERLQFTTGQGPCLEAVRSGDTVLAGAEKIRGRWPVFGEELFSRTPYAAVISLPLDISGAVHGALDLFLTDTPMLNLVSLADATAVQEQIVEAFQLAGAMADTKGGRSGEPEPAWLHGPAAQDRLHVWIAMGMVMTRYELVASDALALLRAHAYGTGSTLDQLAQDLVGGEQELAELQP